MSTVPTMLKLLYISMMHSGAFSYQLLLMDELVIFGDHTSPNTSLNL